MDAEQDERFGAGKLPTIVAPSLQSRQPAPAPAAPADQIADRMVQETASGVQGWLERLAEMMAAATSLPELREMVANAYPELDTSAVAETLAGGFVAAQAAGMSDVEETGA